MEAFANFQAIRADVVGDARKVYCLEVGIQNADDTVREGTIEAHSPEWYALAVTTYYSMLDDTLER